MLENGLLFYSKLVLRERYLNIKRNAIGPKSGQKSADN